VLSCCGSGVWAQHIVEWRGELESEAVTLVEVDVGKEGLVELAPDGRRRVQVGHLAFGQQFDATFQVFMYPRVVGVQLLHTTQHGCESTVEKVLFRFELAGRLFVSHILVLQWPGSSEAHFDELIKIEEDLEQALTDGASVDGHDFGSGEMNIFIETDEPSRTFATVKQVLSRRPSWAGVRAAYREATGDTYTVLWPAGLTDFKVK